MTNEKTPADVHAHPDPVDQAAYLTERAQAAALANRQRPPEAVDPETLSAEDYMCEECDDWVPSARRHAGYTICVPCREEQDRQEGAAMRSGGVA